MPGVNRFCVMATLQAARAFLLGLPIDSAYSWGLNRACYSEDTCVLTENGWKLHPDIEAWERIMAFDPYAKSIWYEVPKKLLSYHYQGEMVHFKTKLVDILVTPEHTIVYKSSGRPFDKSPLRFARANELVGRRILLPGTASWRGGEDKEIIEVPEFLKRNGSIGPSLLQAVRIPIATWLELAGYYLSEGGMDTKNHYVFGLSQGKGHAGYVEKIRQVLSQLPFHSHEYADATAVRWNVGNKQLCEFIVKCFGEGSTGKYISSEFKNLPPDRLKVILDALLRGDGTKKGERFIRLSTTSKRLAHDVEEIAVKLGWSTNMRIGSEAEGNRSTGYCVSFRLAKYRDVQKHRITKVNYDGKVYCFSTSTGFYVTMRNGKVAFQGNTFYAAAKRGFKGGPDSSLEHHGQRAPGESEGPKEFRLGDDLAFRESREGKMLFTIGGKIQTKADFEKQIVSRFNGKFEDAWKDALDLLRNYEKEELLSQSRFYGDVYRPVRDSLVEKWSALASRNRTEPVKGESKTRNPARRT